MKPEIKARRAQKMDHRKRVAENMKNNAPKMNKTKGKKIVPTRTKQKSPKKLGIEFRDHLDPEFIRAKRRLSTGPKIILKEEIKNLEGVK